MVDQLPPKSGSRTRSFGFLLVTLGTISITANYDNLENKLTLPKTEVLQPLP